MKLFIVHVGFYDPDLGKGIFEFHTNFFIVAADAATAKKQVLAKEEFQKHKMHIDGIKEMTHVDGYKICLEKLDSAANDESEVIGYRDAKQL